MPKATSLVHQRIAFVLRYFAERSFGRDHQGTYRSIALEATTTFDDGTDFCVAFAEAFPGRKPDPDHLLSSKRLTNVLRRMWEDGWLERWRLGNEVDLPGTPRWQFVYKVSDRTMTELKTGKLTPEDAAIRYLGPRAIGA